MYALTDRQTDRRADSFTDSLKRAALFFVVIIRGTYSIFVL